MHHVLGGSQGGKKYLRCGHQGKDPQRFSTKTLESRVFVFRRQKLFLSRLLVQKPSVHVVGRRPTEFQMEIDIFGFRCAPVVRTWLRRTPSFGPNLGCKPVQRCESLDARYLTNRQLFRSQKLIKTECILRYSEYSAKLKFCDL